MPVEKLSEKCPTCSVEMNTKEYLFSGNAKYKMYLCRVCGREKAVCLGVMRNA